MYLLDKEMGKGGTQHPALETKEHGTEGCGWREVLGGQREGSNQERPDRDFIRRAQGTILKCF